MIRRLWTLSPSRKWLMLFALWLVFLSGIFANFLGSPGILQAWRLNRLLDAKKRHLTKAQEQLQRLQVESRQLETNRFAQEREVRKVLGYAGQDEIIFDFTPSNHY